MDNRLQSHRVSVVVLTRNRREEVIRALNWARRSAPESPLIVVDNASTDDTVSQIRRHFPDVHLVSAAANLGAAGRNLGVEIADTDYVAFCDDDVGWMPQALARACEILDCHLDVAVLSAAIVVGAEGSPDPACEPMARSPLPGEPDIGPALVGFMAGACVMRVSAFRQVGGYWPGLFLGGEELLLALDLMEKGWRILYAPQIMARHWPSLNRDAAARRRLLARNALLIAWMRLPWRPAVSEMWRTLRQLPDWHVRLDALMEAAHHAHISGARHRPVSERTCSLLARVRGAEGPPHRMHALH